MIHITLSKYFQDLFVMFRFKRKTKFHKIDTIKLGVEIIQRVNNAK